MFWLIEIGMIMILCFCIKLLNDNIIEEKKKKENKNTFMIKQYITVQVMLIVVMGVLIATTARMFI